MQVAVAELLQQLVLVLVLVLLPLLVPVARKALLHKAEGAGYM
jgi:hypothetical protein